MMLPNPAMIKCASRKPIPLEIFRQRDSEYIALALDKVVDDAILTAKQGWASISPDSCNPDSCNIVATCKSPVGAIELCELATAYARFLFACNPIAWNTHQSSMTESQRAGAYSIFDALRRENEHKLTQAEKTFLHRFGNHLGRSLAEDVYDRVEEEVAKALNLKFEKAQVLKRASPQ